MSLTPDQARTLWEAGGFALLQGLPEGSETGMDGVFHSIKVFAGHKFVPPGFHMVVWCASPDRDAQPEPETDAVDEEIETPGAAAATAAAAASTAASDLAAAFPLRTAYIHIFVPRERVGIVYDRGHESASLVPVDSGALPTLDPKLAAYPFAALDGWKALSGAVTAAVVKHVLGQLVFVDSLTGEEGGDEIGALREALAAGRKRKVEDQEETSTTHASKGEAEGRKEGEDGEPRSPVQHRLQFPVFNLKRSWNAGATGDDLSRWSRDKSVLLARMCNEVGGPSALLGHLQLAFLLVTQVWNFASLGAYKRLLSLWCRSPVALAMPADPAVGLPTQATQDAVLALLGTLAAQLAALPVTAFDTELPDLDTFYEAELEQLRRNLGAALAERGWWARAARVAQLWSRIQAEGQKRGWNIEDMPMGDEDSDEEGEYAPVVVDT